MLSGVEPRLVPFQGMKKEEGEEQEEEQCSTSPKTSSQSPASAPDESANNASSSMKISPEAGMPVTTSSSFNPTPPFSQFSAAHLFGLFENGFEKANKINNKMPNDNKNDGMNFPLIFGSNFGNDNGNGSLSLPSSASKSGMPMPMPSATTPIDQLLQISQQILTDGMTKQQQQQSSSNGQGMVANGTGTGRSGRGSGSENGGNGGAGGKQHGEISERKRTYPYTFQYCVLCQKNVHSSKLPCHIRQCHVGKPMFQCPVCDFTSTYSKNNVKSHMVSLHGLAGDPISYMDQYAAQVEDFMKKCFPNVRGRGRPIHGRLSPAAKQQLMASPTSAIVSSGSSVRSSISTSNSIAATELTPPSGQHRRHSSVALFSTSSNGGSPPQQPRGRQKASQRTAANNGNASAAQGMTTAATMGGLAGNAFASGDFYGAMGLLGATGALPKSHHNSQNEQQLNMLEKFGFPNGFTPAPSFNPFFYLQQLNGLFPTGAAFHSNGVDVKSLGVNEPKEEEMAEENSTIMLEESTAGNLLEECLSLSQKFLREMNSDVKPNDGEARAELEPKGTMAMTTCHSSSSTASPPSRPFDLLANPGSSFPPDFHTDEPRYFPQSLGWTVLDGPGLEKTVFSTFSSSNELVEKFDLTPFESLLEQDSASSLLTAAQKRKVADVRGQLNLQLFEILFALHRLDQSILKPAQVRLVEQIAPTRADARRFALFEQSNSLGSLDKDEQFVLELSKVDRLREKLAVMAFVGEFEGKVAQISQHLQSFCLAAKLLFNSAQFHTLLHLLLTSANLISGDFSAQLVKGFHPARIPGMCAFRFPNGTVLLELLVQVVQKHFLDLLQFVDQSEKVVQEAAQLGFDRILGEFHSLERGQALVEEEMHLAEGGGGDGKNQQLAKFLAHCSAECAQLGESIQSTKVQLLSTLEFFGHFCEQSPQEQQQNFRPEDFFAVIAQFFADLRNTASNST